MKYLLSLFLVLAFTTTSAMACPASDDQGDNQDGFLTSYCPASDDQGNDQDGFKTSYCPASDEGDSDPE